MTGASRGLGREIAVQLAQGWSEQGNVTLHRSQEKPEDDEKRGVLIDFLS